MTHPKNEPDEPALQERLRRSNLPEWSKDMSLWPSFDDSLLTGKDKSRYRNLRDGTALYLRGSPMTEVTATAGVGERRFHRIFKRCFMRDSTGKILGCRAFARGVHIAPPKVTNLKTPTAGGRGGFYGAFRLILRDYPGVPSKLVTYLNGYGIEGLRPNKILFRQLRRKFLEICKEEQVPTDGYPAGTQPLRRQCHQNCRTAGHQPQDPLGKDEATRCHGVTARNHRIPPMNCLTTAWSQHQRELGNWSRHKLRNQADVDDFLQSCF